MNKITNPMVLNRQKKKALALRTFIVAVFMALFTQVAQAQTVTVFMRDGSTTIERNTGTVLFYDSHGPSNSTEWWNQWYQHDENYTYVFKPKKAGDKIKVTFHPAPCYDGNTGAELGDWALRINDDYLSVYEGNGISEATLIATLTGNTQSGFSFMTDGAMTFHFVSNSRYREEGWYATVELVTEDDGMQPQAPFLRRSICYNAVELLPTTLGAKIWYTIDGSDPLEYGILYENEIPFPASGGFTVKAVSKLSGEDDFSPVATATFTDADRIPTPGIPTITPETGTNIVKMTPADVPDGVNETYVVRYTFTTNGTDPAEPDLANSTLYTEPISCTVPGTKFKAKTFGLSCGNWVSTATASYTATTIYCPKPVISFEDMTISASESGVTYNIIYTLDGTEPSLSPEHGTTSATTVSLTNLAYGTTVKAMAYKMNGDAIDTQYQPSAVVSAIYVPTDENGNTQNGTYGNTVLLDDREDHTWSYYADKTQPIHKLNPADVKITYYGNGTKNMTSSSENGVNPTTFSKDATGVHVNIDAPENQFIYIKTLENDKEDGTGNYPYTTIPNPFQVRPTLQSGKGVEDAGQSNTNGAAMVEGTMSQSVLTSEEFIRSPRPQTTIANETSVGNRDASVAVVSGGTASNANVPMYNWYCDYSFTSEYIIPASYFTAANITNGTVLSAITLFQNTAASWTAKTLTIKLTNTSTASYSTSGLLGSNGTTVYTNSSYSSNSASSHTFSFSTPFTYTGGSLIVQISAANGGTASSSSTSSTWSGVSTSTNQGYYVYGSGSTSGSLQQFIPNTTFAVSSSNPTISVSPTTVTVKTGFTTTLTATTANVDATTMVNWSSSNTAVATVSANGKGTSSGVVTGVSAGTATITASMTVDGTTYTASSVVTVEDPSYCSPAPTRIDGEGITNVAFGSGSETVNNSNHPTTSPYYGDYSSLVGAYQRGSTASVDITFATGYTYGTVIWVDWDNDYEFEDSEVVYTGTSGAANPTTLTATFTIPASQAIGNYRMRIGAADSYFDSFIGGNTSADHDPCYSGTSWSVFHDYTLHVTESVEAPVFSPEAGYYTSAQTVTITCATSGASIYYTLDGSTPTTSSTLYSTPLSINATTTVKAIAVKDNVVSTITSGTYTINTSGGGSMTCEDFEDYASSANTSYSTAGSLPNGWDCGALSSTTYQASYAPHLYNGSVAVDGVGIIVTAGYDGTYGGAYWIDTDITLEEGATLTFNTWVENTSYGTLSYGYFVGNNFTSMGVATTASWSGASNTDGLTTATVPSAANGYVLSFIWRYSTSTSGDNYSAIIDNICQETTGAPSAPVFSLASGDYTGTQTVTITCSTEGATIYYTTNGTTPSATNGQTITSGNSVTISSTTTLQAVAVNSYGSSAVTSATYTITQGVSSNSDYRGFYAWRLKRVSDGLTIKSKDGNTTYTTADGSNVIPAETELQFITSNAEGNEVEFEALWAQAYVVECSTNNGLSTAIASSNLNANVGYERNFVVVTGGTQTSDINNTSQKPVTITGVNPDGTGTMSSSRYLAGGFTANKNTKFENIYMQNTDTPYTLYLYTYNRCYRTGNQYSGYTYYYYHENTDTWTTSQSDATVLSRTSQNSFTVGNYVTLTGDTYNGNQVYMYVLTKTPETHYTYTTYDGNGHDLVFGRGISPRTSGGVCVGLVKGIGSSSTATLNYTVRIESGVFNHVSFISGYNDNQGNGVVTSLTFSGSNNRIKGVLGCDYDRALESASDYNYSNAPLRIVYNMIVGATVSLSNQDETEFFTSTIKSGYYGSGYSDLGEGDAYQSFYLGVANTYNTGKRTLTIEGGKLNLSLAGGIDTGNTSNDALTIRMKGGTVAGAVYGAAAFAASAGGRKFVFTGGTVNGWIAGGCNGTKTTGGKLDGSTFVYFGGNAKCDSNGSTVTIGAGEATGGNIFGAGSGNKDAGETATVGEVDNSTIVIADNAIVERNVYGGGNYGYVCAGTNHKSDLYVLGGKVNGSVFGGANLQKGQIVNITMKDGEVVNNVYGGSNASGSISGLATINVSGGTVSNVFGGGYGSATMMNSGTQVNISGGTITGNVYGGGEEGELKGSANNAIPNSDAVVTVSGGTVTDVFGAGKGGNGHDANVSGNTTVTVSGGTVNGAVYGGGENGTINPVAAYAESTTTTEDITQTLGTLNNYGSTYIPINTYYYYGHSQTIYQASDLTPGVINTIGYNYYSGTAFNRYLTIYMGTTSSNTSTWINPSSLTTVYNGQVQFTSSGWKDIQLTTPFNYNGTDNLVVVIHYDRDSENSTYLNSVGSFYYTSSDYSCHRSYFSDNSISNPPTSAGSAYSYYPVTRFTITTSSTTSPDTDTPEDLVSTVTVSGGEVKGDVFGGGKMGTTAGSTIVNVKGGILRQNVFGGAYGSHGSVYVGGLKTVNMMGGRVYGSVYGGSRNANDANVLAEYSSTEKAATSITNISGGQIEQHVYAAGYYGNTYGSVYAFLGLSAINNAPNHAPTNGLEYTKNRIVINGNVWAGGDWGTFNGTFGAPTVSGNSNVYIDGQGYSTEGNDPAATNYMNIAGSILGSGTSCDAGTFERTLIVRHYGADIANTGNDADVNPVSRASRQANSIQRFHKVIFDDSHLGLIGQGKINSLNNTEKYALYEIDSAVYIANGTTLVMNAPSSQLKSFHSVTCEDTYAASPAYSVVGYNGLTTSETDNKIRVNGGSYLEVKYAADPDHIASGEKIYGELEGFSHIMTSNDSNDATCAYARPKQSNEAGNIIPTAENNANDGGFVSYLARYNQYTADGSMVAEGGQVQLRYENHTPNMRDNSEYFRIWRYGGKHHNYEGILNAEATTGGTDYKTVTVTVQLPAWTSKDSYYRFDRTGTSTLNTRIDYGSDVLTYNAACYQDPTTGNNWMYFDYEDNAQVTGVGSTNEVIAANLAAGIDDAPNLNYGLVIKPGQAMSGSNYIICSDADEYLANLDNPFTCSDNTKVPSITFTLTYSNNLTANMTWDPIVVPLVQCDKNGNITDYVNVSLVINTSTEITSGFVTQVYARMIGGTNTKEQATVNVVLPTFTVADTGEESQFTLVKAVFTPDEALNPNTGAVDANYDVSYEVKNNSTNLDINSFFLTVSAVSNPDNTDDWRFITGEQDGATGDGTAMHKDIGQAGGRSALTFGISLYYNNNISVTDQTHMGDVTFTIGFTNYEDGDPDNEHYSEFTVTVEIYRIGRGKNFYVDGVNGLDVSGEGRGKYPDLPAKTVNYIFNRLGFLPGDNIFVVDEMPIEKATTWDGSTFQNEVNIYRYPGGHNLSVETSNFDNSPYLGSLATITKELNMKGVTMDGMYAEAILPANEHNSALYPDACTFNGVADAPMIVVEDGGRLNLSTVTTLKNNYNNNNKVRGGAVNVNYGGVLAMNMASAIKDNINAQGGGVFVDGAMIVSDSIYVYDNYVNTAKTKQNNVYLAPMTQEKLDREGSFRVVQIGTSAADAYNELQRTATASYDTKIGITKEDWDNTYEGYMPVVYAESGTESFLDKPYAHPQDLIVHDGGIYSLERYVTDLHSDSPNYLYWLGTWVTAQYWNPYYESNEAEGYTPYMTAAQLNNISTPEQLAWVISLANGENGVDKTDEDYVFSTVNITNDIDMSANIWVPIGNEEGAFKGTFKGNGHVISGLKGSLNRTNLAMFGATDGATISDMVVNTNFNATATNMGTVIGTMKGGTLSNVEGAGTIINNYAEGNTGGLVGVNEATGTAGEIHSSFAAADITGGKNIGGLVAVNNGNLINAYSNATIKGGANVGGLVAINGGRVENCYNVTETTYPFAATNNGTITVCYAAEVELEEGEEMVYVGGGTGSLTGHGTYGTVLDRKKPGYLYNDNQVTLVSGQTNANVAEALSYTGGKIEKWPGLLSTLNQWVSKNAGYTSWLRPTTADINGDLPVLCFPKDNCLGTVTGRALRYSAFDDRTNGLDNLLSLFEDKTGYVFLYGNATEVENVPDEDVNVFINEDAVLLQKQQAGGTKANEANFINTTVGITFDNSDHGQNATDYFGDTLFYDWHLMSTPLADAKLGISYATDAETGYGKPADWSKVENSYMPDMTNGSDEEEGGDTGEGGKEGEDPEAEEDNTVKWDFYTYFEPQYHWINFKRSAGNHWHYDEPHDNIDYTGNEQTKGNLTAGRGYMMAISQDSYLNQTGTLNNGDVKIELTLSGDQTSDTEPTKDWGSNLIGNPYQAYLDLDVVSDETGLESFYVYDADNGTYGPYMTGASVNPAIPSQYIHPHQGFFAVINDAYVNAHSANAGDGGGKDEYTPKTVNVTLSYNMATAEKLPTSYFRGERIDYPVVNIFATNEKGSRDLAIIELGRPELNGVRKIENLRNANFKLYAHYDGGNYGLLFTPIDAKRVPVHFRTMEDGQFTLTWSTYNGTFTNLTLVDNLTGVRTNMLATDHYTFNGSVDDYAARFYITFNVTGVDEIDGGSDDFAWFDGNDWIVTGQGQLEVIDVTGRVLQSRRVSGEQTRLHLDNVAAGVYMMRLTEGNRAKVQKIVVK